MAKIKHAFVSPKSNLGDTSLLRPSDWNAEHVDENGIPINIGDISIYALLAGRVGGQTLYGGTGAGDNLTLYSTSNITKGEVFVDDKFRVSGHSAFGPAGILDGDGFFGITNSSILDIREEFTTIISDFAQGSYANITVNPPVDPAGFKTISGFGSEISIKAGNTLDLPHILLNSFFMSVFHFGTGRIPYALGMNNLVSNTDIGIIDSAQAIRNDVTNWTGIITEGIGIYNIISNDGTGEITNGYGVLNWINNSGSGHIITAYGDYTKYTNGAGGYIVNSYGLAIKDWVNAGTMDNVYGIYIQDLSSFGSSLSYNIYSAGATSKNIFEGTINGLTLLSLSSGFSLAGGTTPKTITVDETGSLSSYSLLAGRAGGQTLYGDTAASGNLILESTYHGTKGVIQFGINAADLSAVTKTLKAADSTTDVAGAILGLQGGKGSGTKYGPVVIPNGRLGIGAAPTVADIEITKGTTAHFYINTTDGTSYSRISVGGHIIYGFNTSYSGSGKYIVSSLLLDANGQLTLNTQSSAPIAFYINNAEKMRLDTSGQLGIGKVSPASRLDIGAGAMTLAAMSAPATPAADNKVIYVKASGTTPTRIVSLCVKDEVGTEFIIQTCTV